MTKPTDNEVKIWFEANYLDGDKIQDGQMIASSECFEAILQVIDTFRSLNSHRKEALTKNRIIEILVKLPLIIPVSDKNKIADAIIKAQEGK